MINQIHPSYTFCSILSCFNLNSVYINGEKLSNNSKGEKYQLETAEAIAKDGKILTAYMETSNIKSK